MLIINFSSLFKIVNRHVYKEKKYFDVSTVRFLALKYLEIWQFQSRKDTSARVFKRLITQVKD